MRCLEPVVNPARPFIISAAVVFALLAAAVTAPARADDFRIASQIFTTDDDVATSTNTTLFHGGVVYDFLDGASQTTIFDPAHRRFVLLDSERKLRSEVPTEKVAAFNSQLQTRAAAHEDLLFRFMAHPKFEAEIDEKSGELIFSSPHMTYRLSAVPVKDTSAIRRYIEFSDWYARLNTMLNVGSPPPYARILVNRTLRERLEIPTAVSLSIVAKDAEGHDRTVLLKSRHEIQWRLSSDDARKIDETATELATFRRVSLDDYLAGDGQQANRGADGQ